MESQIFWCLGQGLVDFWYDRWCADWPLAQLLGLSDPPHFLVKEFYSGHGWNLARLREWIPDNLV